MEDDIDQVLNYIMSIIASTRFSLVAESGVEIIKLAPPADPEQPGGVFVLRPVTHTIDSFTNKGCSLFWVAQDDGCIVTFIDAKGYAFISMAITLSLEMVPF